MLVRYLTHLKVWVPYIRCSGLFLNKVYNTGTMSVFGFVQIFYYLKVSSSLKIKKYLKLKKIIPRTLTGSLGSGSAALGKGRYHGPVL